MKNIFASLILTLALPLSAFASTLSLTPSTISVTPGQVFSVTIAVSPQEADYTVKTTLSYSAGLLEVVSFTQASGWLPLTQPGYDLIDNASGSLVKTAGYAGGFSSAKVFGTVTFKALAAGSATISVGGGAQILDANNGNTFTSGNRVGVTITAPAAALPMVPVQKAAPTKNTSNPTRSPLTPAKKETAMVSTSTDAVASSTVSVATTSEAVENVAAVAGARTQEVSLALGALSTVLAFSFGIFIGRRQKRSY